VILFLIYVLGLCLVYLLSSSGNGNFERSRDVRCMPDNDI
jgi:hypothetical protein